MNWKLIITVIISSLQVLIMLVPLFGKLSDNRSDFPKNFTRLGWKLALFGILTMILTILLFYISDKEEGKYRSDLVSQLRTRDSLNNIKIDSNNQETIELLAKYGLKYDSSQNQIVKLIKDSIKNSTTIIDENKPTFGICYGNGIRVLKNANDTIFLKTLFCYSNSPSNISVKIYLLSIYNTKWVLIGSEDKFFERKMPLESGQDIQIPLQFYDHIKLNKYYLIINGEYSNKDNSQKFKLNDGYFFDIANNSQEVISDKIKNDINTFISLKK